MYTKRRLQEEFLSLQTKENLEPAVEACWAKAKLAFTRAEGEIWDRAWRI